VHREAEHAVLLYKTLIPTVANSVL